MFDKQKMWPDSVAQSDARLTLIRSRWFNACRCSQVIVVCYTPFSHMRQTLGT